MVAKVDSFSPSASKPAAVVESWLRLGVPIQIIEPTPVTVQQLYAAHDKGYVDDVLSCKIANGFGTKSKKVADTLLWTSGAMLSAAREAIKNGAVAVAPVSGFHHAHHAYGHGYCSFNGLMVTAIALLNEGAVRSVGIVDLDNHEGDGSNDIVETLGLQDRVLHFTAGAKWHRPSQASAFLEILPDIVASLSACDVLLVQLGADPHVNDFLGGWMTTKQLQQRDRIVFETARRVGLPTCFNLAGGYQKPLRKVLDLHDNTMMACADAYYGNDAAVQITTGEPAA